MENILLSLAFLACPVGMGLMMWFMAKGNRKEPSAAQPPGNSSVEQLREEHSRLATEIERLEASRPSPWPAGPKLACRAMPPEPHVPPGLHEFESTLMEIVWELGESNVRAVLDEINERSDKERKYTTVMTTMARLERKGLLVRRRQGKTDYYTPVHTREQYLETRARAEVGALIENYGEAALVHFARQMDQLDPKRREQLRRLARRGPS